MAAGRRRRAGTPGGGPKRAPREPPEGAGRALRLAGAGTTALHKGDRQRQGMCVIGNRGIVASARSDPRPCQGPVLHGKMNSVSRYPAAREVEEWCTGFTPSTHIGVCLSPTCQHQPVCVHSALVRLATGGSGTWEAVSRRGLAPCLAQLGHDAPGSAAAQHRPAPAAVPTTGAPCRAAVPPARAAAGGGAAQAPCHQRQWRRAWPCAGGGRAAPAAGPAARGAAGGAAAAAGSAAAGGGAPRRAVAAGLPAVGLEGAGHADAQPVGGVGRRPPG